ncbi:MAG: hypothetical protein HND52_02565 [Ignavibacteriae bacterium]|nr:hypothetical protein [Ignavibacteriota bacterium]
MINIYKYLVFLLILFSLQPIMIYGQVDRNDINVEQGKLWTDSNIVRILDCYAELPEVNMKRNNLNFLNISNNKSIIIAEYSARNTKGGMIYFYRLLDGRQSELSYLGKSIWINHMVMSHNEDYIIVATFERKSSRLQCYSLEEERLFWENKRIDDYYFGVWFSEDNNEIIAFGSDAIYKVKIQTGEVINEMEVIHDEYSFDGHKETWVNHSTSGKYIVIWQRQAKFALLDFFRKSANENITVWDIDKGKKIVSMPLDEKYFRTAVFSPDEKFVLLGGYDRFIHFWSIEKNEIVNKVPGEAIHMVLNSNNNMLAISLMNDEGNFEVKIYEYPDMKLITKIYPFTDSYTIDGIMPINFDKTGKYFAIERDGKLFLYDTSDWSVLWCIETDP